MLSHLPARLPQVLPGGRVPTDGVVVVGQSHANESMITGEARLVRKGPGDKVIGGTINAGNMIIMEATKVRGRGRDRWGGGARGVRR